MKKGRRILALILAVVCALSVGMMASARYKEIISLGTGLSINSSGKATCTGSVDLYETSYKAQMSIMLQQSSNGTSWSTIKSWNATGYGGCTISQEWYVAKGYYYQVLSDVAVFDTSNYCVDTATGKSPVRYY